MVTKSRQKKLRSLITEAIRVLCKNGLDNDYQEEFSIEGLLGITLDNQDVFLVNINETIRNDEEEEDEEDLPSRAVQRRSTRTPVQGTPNESSKPSQGSGGGGGGTPAGRAASGGMKRKIEAVSPSPGGPQGGAAKRQAPTRATRSAAQRETQDSEMKTESTPQEQEIEHLSATDAAATEQENVQEQGPPALAPQEQSTTPTPPPTTAAPVITYEGEEEDESPLTRQAGPPCDCPLNCYSKIPVAYRKELLRMFWRMDSEVRRDAYLAECILFDEGFYTAPKPSQTSPVLHIIKRGNKAVRVCKKAFLGVFGLHRSGRWRVEELEREMVRTKEELKVATPGRGKKKPGPPFVLKREGAGEDGAGSPEDQYDFPEGTSPPARGRVTRRSLNKPAQAELPARGRKGRASHRGAVPGGRFLQHTQNTRPAPNKQEGPDNEEEVNENNEAEPETQQPEQDGGAQEEEARDPHALFIDPQDPKSAGPPTIRTRKSAREAKYMDMMNKVEHVEQHISVFVTGPLEDYKGKYSGEEDLVNWSEDDIRHWYNHYVQKYCVEQEYDAVSFELYRKLFKKATKSEGDLSDEELEPVGLQFQQEDPNKLRIGDVPGLDASQQPGVRRGGGVRTRGGVGGGVTRGTRSRPAPEEEDEIVFEGEIPGEPMEHDAAQGEEGDVVDQEQPMETVMVIDQVIDHKNALVAGVELIPHNSEVVHVIEQPLEDGGGQTEQPAAGPQGEYIQQQVVQGEGGFQVVEGIYPVTTVEGGTTQIVFTPTTVGGQDAAAAMFPVVTTSGAVLDQVYTDPAVSQVYAVAGEAVPGEGMVQAGDPGLMPPAPTHAVPVHNGGGEAEEPGQQDEHPHVVDEQPPGEEIESYVTAAHGSQRLPEADEDGQQEPQEDGAPEAQGEPEQPIGNGEGAHEPIQPETVSPVQEMTSQGEEIPTPLLKEGMEVTPGDSPHHAPPELQHAQSDDVTVPQESAETQS